MRKFTITSEFLRNKGACSSGISSVGEGITISTDVLWNIHHVLPRIQNIGHVTWLAESLGVDVEDFYTPGPCWCNDPGCGNVATELRNTDTVAALVAVVADTLVALERKNKNVSSSR